MNTSLFEKTAINFGLCVISLMELWALPFYKISDFDCSLLYRACAQTGNLDYLIKVLHCRYGYQFTNILIRMRTDHITGTEEVNLIYVEDGKITFDIEEFDPDDCEYGEDSSSIGCYTEELPISWMRKEFAEPYMCVARN